MRQQSVQLAIGQTRADQHNVAALITVNALCADLLIVTPFRHKLLVLSSGPISANTANCNRAEADYHVSSIVSPNKITCTGSAYCRARSKTYCPVLAHCHIKASNRSDYTDQE